MRPSFDIVDAIQAADNHDYKSNLNHKFNSKI